MKISFNGNHIYMFPNTFATISAYEKYKENSSQTRKNMIISAQDNCIHIIDGRDARNFECAENLNKNIVNKHYLFKTLINAYKKKATLVDFSDVKDKGLLI